MAQAKKARAIGFNHVALEVGDIDEALAFYGRLFGLVVDDKEAVRRTLAEAAVDLLPGPFLDFRDPWGNRIEIVGYDNIQFTKAPNVLRGMGLAHLSKNKSAIKELKDKGMAPS